MKETRAQNTVWEMAKDRIGLKSGAALVNVLYKDGAISENIPVINRDIFLKSVDWPSVVDVHLVSQNMTQADVFRTVVENYRFENMPQVFSLYEKFGFYRLVDKVGFLGESLKDGMCSVMQDGSVLVFDEVLTEKFDVTTIKSADDQYLLENGMYDTDGETLIDFVGYNEMDMVLEANSLAGK